jgi:hypothetical protein
MHPLVDLVPRQAGELLAAAGLKGQGSVVPPKRFRFLNAEQFGTILP